METKMYRTITDGNEKFCNDDTNKLMYVYIFTVIHYWLVGSKSAHFLRQQSCLLLQALYSRWKPMWPFQAVLPLRRWHIRQIDHPAHKELLANRLLAPVTHHTLPAIHTCPSTCIRRHSCPLKVRSPSSHLLAFRLARSSEGRHHRRHHMLILWWESIFIFFDLICLLINWQTLHESTIHISAYCPLSSIMHDLTKIFGLLVVSAVHVQLPFGSYTNIYLHVVRL